MSYVTPVYQEYTLTEKSPLMQYYYSICTEILQLMKILVGNVKAILVVIQYFTCDIWNYSRPLSLIAISNSDSH